jgi:hypothetical protein
MENFYSFHVVRFVSLVFYGLSLITHLGILYSYVIYTPILQKTKICISPNDCILLFNLVTI